MSLRHQMRKQRSLGGRCAGSNSENSPCTLRYQHRVHGVQRGLNILKSTLTVSGAGSAQANGIYSSQQDAQGWFFVMEDAPRFVIRWQQEGFGQPARYLLLDLSHDAAMYCGDTETPTALPRKWRVYDGPRSLPGVAPAPDVAQGSLMPNLFSLPLVVSNAGSADVNGTYLSAMAAGGYQFIKEDDPRFIITWYPEYNGQPSSYYIADLSLGEAALYAGVSSSRGELPAAWSVYTGPDSNPGYPPAPRVTPEILVVSLSFSLSPKGHVLHCRGLSGDVIAQLELHADDLACLVVKDVCGAVAEARGCSPSIVRLVGSNGHVLEGWDQRVFAEDSIAALSDLECSDT